MMSYIMQIWNLYALTDVDYEVEIDDLAEMWKVSIGMFNYYSNDQC